MFTALQPTVYVRVSPQRLTVRDPKSGTAVSEIPEIAIAQGARAQIVAVGAAARAQQSSSTTVVNPFAHPRSLMSDFTSGQALLKAFLRRIQPPSLFSPAPRIVLHLEGDPDGGFTQVEIRAFREMALGAGASEVVIWQGRDLLDQELLARQFPAAGQLLSE